MRRSVVAILVWWNVKCGAFIWTPAFDATSRRATQGRAFPRCAAKNGRGGFGWSFDDWSYKKGGKRDIDDYPRMGGRRKQEKEEQAPTRNQEEGEEAPTKKQGFVSIEEWNETDNTTIAYEQTVQREAQKYGDRFR